MKKGRVLVEPAAAVAETRFRDVQKRPWGRFVARNLRLGRGCRSGLRLRRSRVPWFQGQDQLSPSRRRRCPTHLILRTHHREVRDLATAASSSANLEAKMKIVAAYLLAILGGNPNPSADDIRSILESGDQMYRFVLLLHYTAPSAILLGAISSLRNYGVKEASAYSCSGSIRVLWAWNCILFAYAGSSILGKLALGQGLSALVFVVYRHLIAMLILAPLAYALERNRRPSFSFGVMLKIFILVMLGITIQQNVYYVGLHLISPTVASALGNVIPAFTFLLAIVLRMEKINLKTVRGRAKLAGAIFCITGSLIFTFWKGHFVGGLCYFTYDPTSFRKS
ncbi:hypothetical protein ZIOFF_012465 [Zingiber officinale]|uniref:WAT1-related protein n=1 Tax=Zingiber officinale TaxID=94328 RepID=A0A8J5I817_ZINOF|nr:hypothetical protein ZIOFF_012465 [Zingiber officinale]